MDLACGGAPPSPVSVTALCGKQSRDHPASPQDTGTVAQGVTDLLSITKGVGGQPLGSPTPGPDSRASPLSPFQSFFNLVAGNCSLATRRSSQRRPVPRGRNQQAFYASISKGVDACVQARSS